MEYDLPAPDRDGVVRAHGRELAWAEYGPIDGEPLLFIPGAGSGRLMSFGARHLEDRGIRLISVDRPGMGSSSPWPEATLSEIGALLGRVGTERAGGALPIVANSQGAPFGIAAALAGAASRLVLVSPIDELAHPLVVERLEPGLRTLVHRIRSDRRDAASIFLGFDPDSLFAFIMPGAQQQDADRVLLDPAFRRGFLRVLGDGFRQGSGAYARDTALVMSDWNLPLEEVSVPVSIWSGAEDHDHSLDQGETLAERLHAIRHVVPEAGGGLLWSAAGLILEELVGEFSHLRR